VAAPSLRSGHALLAGKDRRPEPREWRVSAHAGDGRCRAAWRARGVREPFGSPVLLSNEFCGQGAGPPRLPPSARSWSRTEKLRLQSESARRIRATVTWGYAVPPCIRVWRVC